MNIVNKYISDCLKLDPENLLSYPTFSYGKIQDGRRATHIFYAGWLSSKIVYEIVIDRKSGREEKRIHLLQEEKSEWLSYSGLNEVTVKKCN